MLVLFWLCFAYCIVFVCRDILTLHNYKHIYFCLQDRQVYVSGLEEVYVCSREDVYKVLETGECM